MSEVSGHVVSEPVDSVSVDSGPVESGPVESGPAVAEDQTRWAAAAATLGCFFVLAGLALLLQQLGLLMLRWSVVLPGLLLAVGLTVMASGLVASRRDRRHRP